MAVEVVRKNIKNLHLGVYPPNGRVRVAAPLRISKEAVRLAVIGKLKWIKKHKARFDAQPRQSPREMVNGETHYFVGRRYRLRVVEQNCSQSVEPKRNSTLIISVRPGSDVEKRRSVLQGWYRQQLKALIPDMLDKWQKALGVKASFWGVKKMKTKWGSCNVTKKRIWINLELAKKPVECLELIIVHELTHLIEKKHNSRFTGLMDKNLPKWRSTRDLLNKAPLGYDEWVY